MRENRLEDADAHVASHLDWSTATLQEMFEEVDDALERYAATILDRQDSGLPQWLVTAILEHGSDAFDPAWIPTSFLAYLVKTTLRRLEQAPDGDGPVDDIPMSQFANALIAWRAGDHAEALAQIDDIDPELVSLGAVVLHTVATGATDSLDAGRPRERYAYTA